MDSKMMPPVATGKTAENTMSNKGGSTGRGVAYLTCQQAGEQKLSGTPELPVSPLRQPRPGHPSQTHHFMFQDAAAPPGMLTSQRGEEEEDTKGQNHMTSDPDPFIMLSW